MKKRVVIVLLTGLVIASLAGCGAKADATDQEVSESSSAETETDDEIASEEVVGDDTEDEEELGDTNYNGIILFAEKESKDFDALDEIEYTSYNGYLTAESYVPILDGDGYWIGSIEPGTTVSITEMSTDLWARFENPIEGTDYDYLYVRNEMVDSEDFHYDAVKMKQGIENYINTYGIQDAEYTFLDEKASDMELFECRMDSVYDDQTMYEYWVAEQITRNDEVNPLLYGTLYIECEDDTDGWIICRIYYKDLIESEY